MTKYKICNCFFMMMSPENECLLLKGSSSGKGQVLRKKTMSYGQENVEFLGGKRRNSKRSYIGRSIIGIKKAATCDK